MSLKGKISHVSCTQFVPTVEGYLVVNTVHQKSHLHLRDISAAIGMSSFIGVTVICRNYY